MVLLIPILFNFRSHAQVQQCVNDVDLCNFGEADLSTSNCYSSNLKFTQSSKTFFCAYINGSNVRLACNSGIEQLKGADGQLKYDDIMTRSGNNADGYNYSFKNDVFRFCNTCASVANAGTCITPAIGNGNPPPPPPPGGTGTNCIMRSDLQTDSQGNECVFGSGTNSCYNTGQSFSKNFAGIERTFFCNKDNKQVNCSSNITNYSDVFSDQTAGTIRNSACELGASFNAPQPGTCTEATENYLFYQIEGPPYFFTYNTQEENAKRNKFMSCYTRSHDNDACLIETFGIGTNKDSFKRCRCSYPLNLQCAAGVLCQKECRLEPGSFLRLIETKPPTPQSPMAFIQLISNFIFYLAIGIFVVNFLYAGFLYVRSSGEEDKLTEARNRLTNSIGGLVFLILVGSLLTYVVGILASSGLR